VGIGNILLRDEGIGPRVVEALREESLPEGVELLDGGTAGADLLDVLSDRKKVIIIDAMDADLAPGAVLRLGLADLETQSRPSLSLHEIGLGQTLAMAGHLGCEPGEVVIIGVQPQLVSVGDTLTEPLAAAVPQIVGHVLALLAE